MSGTSRRGVLIGAAALGLARIPLPAVADDDGLLVALGAELEGLRRRCQRFGRLARKSGGDGNAAWVRWSRAVDERTALLGRIARTPAHGPAGVMIKVQAVVWELLDDDLVVDETAGRRLAAVGRQLGISDRRPVNL